MSSLLIDIEKFWSQKFIHFNLIYISQTTFLFIFAPSPNAIMQSTVFINYIISILIVLHGLGSDSTSIFTGFRLSFPSPLSPFPSPGFIRWDLMPGRNFTTTKNIDFVSIKRIRMFWSIRNWRGFIDGICGEPEGWKIWHRSDSRMG